MSAPAALAMSKLSYPETKKSRTTAKDVATMGKFEQIHGKQLITYNYNQAFDWIDEI